MDLDYCIKRAQKGDKAAFRKLREFYRPETVFLAARFLLDENEAEAAADAVFRDAQAKLTRLKDPELFERWLSWCTARECRERLRERTPALFTEPKKIPAQDPTAGIPRKGERIRPGKQDLMTGIVEAADGLPVLQRFPFLYCRVCGYSIEETAAFLGLSPETVCFRVRSGEAALYEAVHGLPGAKRAGLDDILIALRDYPVRYVRPGEEELLRAPRPEKRERPLPEPEAEPIEEDEEEDELTEEAEEEKQEAKHRSVLPLMILIGALLLAVLIYLIRWTLKDNKAKRASAREETTISVSALTPAPGAAEVTAIPRTAITPTPSATPKPTDTPEPTYPPPDVTALEYAPETRDWFAKPYSAFVCAESSVTVRNGPTTKNKKLGTVDANRTVIAYAAKDSWYLVEYESGKVGWTSGQYLFAPEMFKDGSNENLAGITAPMQTITTAEAKKVGAFEGAKLYRDPSQNATYSDTLEYGTKVCLLCFEGDWIFVNRKGSFGWMQMTAFDNSDAMDLGNGTYYYAVTPNAVFEDTGSAVRVEATLYRQEFITPENLEKFIAGETAKTKHGTKLKPSFTAMEKSERTTDSGMSTEYIMDDGELRFVYDAEQGLYAVYTYSQPKLYSVKKLVLAIRPDAKVIDRKYCPNYETGVPSYGSADADGSFLTYGASLDDYVLYVSSFGVYEGLSGTITVKNGAVCEITVEQEE